MSGIYDLISSQLTEDRVLSITQSIGPDPAQTQQAISAALPTLLGALARNASTPQGEQQLHQALVSDHDGSILDQDGDGDVDMMDIVKFGMSRLFGRS